MGIETKKDFDLDDLVARKVAADAELERGNDGIAYLLQHIVTTPRGKLWFSAGANNPGRRMVKALWNADWDDFIKHYNKSPKSQLSLYSSLSQGNFQVQFIRHRTVAAYLPFSTGYIQELFTKYTKRPVLEFVIPFEITTEAAPWIVLDSIGLSNTPFFSSLFLDL